MWTIILTATALVGAVGAPSARPAAGAGLATVNIPFERYHLANGLEVILHQDDLVPRVYVGVLYHVGSGNETPGKSGLAHLFEHMMFRGSLHVAAGRHHEVIRAAGGAANATTTTDRTYYFQEVPAHQLETVLWLESDRMGYLPATLSEHELRSQRDVVSNERRQTFEMAAYGKELLEVSRLLFDDGHPYRYMAIGRHEDIARATMDELRAFFGQWYVPANATLVIAGDFEVGKTKLLINKWFGSFPRTEKPVPVQVAPTKLVREVRQVIDDDLAAHRRVHYAWHTPHAFSKDDLALDVVAQILGRPGSGRLAQRLGRQRRWARNVLVAQKSRSFSSVFHLAVDLQPDADLAAVEKVIDEELTALATAPVSAQELTRVLTAIETSYLAGIEPLAARGELLQTYNHFTSDPGAYAQHLHTLRGMQPADLQDAVRKHLGRDCRVVVVTRPGAGAKGERAAASLEAW